MPHVAFVPFTGLRVGSDELRELGFSLPGLKQRSAALAEKLGETVLTVEAEGFAPQHRRVLHVPDASRRRNWVVAQAG